MTCRWSKTLACRAARPAAAARTAGVDDDCVARLKPMARRVVESAPLRGRDACARLRVFAIDELTGRDSYEARRAEGSKKSTRL